MNVLDVIMNARDGSAARQGSLIDLLAPILDRDRDGSLADDVGGIVGGMFGRS